MFELQEKENLILKVCRSTKKDIYIYGAGEMGGIVADRLEKADIPVSGFCVDRLFWKKDEEYKNMPVFCIDDIVIGDNTLIIVAMKGFDTKKMERLQKATEVLTWDAMSLFSIDLSQMFDYTFFEEKQPAIAALYNELADDKSRIHLEAFLNQKISGDFKYLENVYEDNQYYDEEIIDFNRIESFVDCGAYDGDSWQAFLKNYREHTGKEYNGTAVLLEPDSYDECVANCGTDKRCRILQLGAWERKDKLKFSVKGTSSLIDENVGGGIIVEVDSIDNILDGGKADFIKLDIEGSELKALEGARETIRKYNPIIAVCVYHKREDLVTIPQYIKSICPDYRMYIRAYSRYAQELVLYAVI